MLTQQERDFLRYWENNRLRRKKTMRQFLVGIPIGLLFVIPIVINFTSGWYKRAQMEAGSSDFNPMVLLVALLAIVVFTAIFYQRHQWDQYEQRYRELLAKEKREEDAAGGSAEPAMDADISGKTGEN
jgi:membrane protein YdbS with pleckstrin-like domain